jgi:hypothetical protein
VAGLLWGIPHPTLAGNSENEQTAYLASLPFCGVLDGGTLSKNEISLMTILFSAFPII